MSFQPLQIAPFQTGLDSDVEPWLAPPDSFTTLDNFHIRHGVVEKRLGYRLYGTLGANRVMGIYRYIRTDNSSVTIAFDTQRAYRYNGTTNSFDILDAASIMNCGVYDYVTATLWHSSNLVNRLYFTNGLAYDGVSLNGIRYYDDSGLVTLPLNPSLGGTNFLYGAKFVFSIRQRLIALNTYEYNGAATTNYPQRMRWCQAQTPSVWNSVTPGQGGYIDAPTGEQIISARSLQDLIIVQFTNSVWAIRPYPDPNIPFRWNKINDFRACDGKMATVGYDRDVKAIGVRGITATDGVETKRIDSRIESFTTNNIVVDEFGKVFCARSYANKRWWTLYCDDKDVGENNKALIYDDDTGAFSTYTISLNCLGYGNFERDFGFDDFSVANDMDFSFSDMSEETFESYFWQDKQETFLGGDINGNIYVLETQGDDTSTEITTEFFTVAWNPFKDQGFASQMSYIDLFVDTDQNSTGTIEFYKDNNKSPYSSQQIDFLPNLNYLATIINATQTNPVNINAPDHGLSTGDGIYIYLVKGMIELNGLFYNITVVDNNNFTLDGINGTTFTAYTTGGVATEREFYRTKTWKRAYAGGNGYQHRIRFTSEGTDTPIRIHALKPYFRQTGRELN